MGKLFDFLVQEFDICSVKSDISVIDSFKLYQDMNVYRSKLEQFDSINNQDVQNPLSPLEKYVLMMETDPLKEISIMFSQNHQSGYFDKIFFMLSNPDAASTKIFNILYDNRELMHKMADHVKRLWNDITTKKYHDVDLKEFYNRQLVDMFLHNLEYEKPDHTIDSTNQKFDDMWDNYFIPATRSIRDFVRGIRYLFKEEDPNNRCGLSNFNPELYRYMFKQNVGLDLSSDPKSMIDHMYQLLDENIQNCVQIGKELYGADIIYAYDDLCEMLESEPDQIFRSDEEIIDLHKSYMEMYRKMYVEDLGFPMKNEVKLVVFNNISLAGGIYDQDVFYLNLADSSTTRRYDVEALVLHETIPGHHLQIDISTYSDQVDPLTFVYDSMTNGFSEGWALVAEHLYDRSKLTHRQSVMNEYGRLQMNILRTYRVIADIKLHIYGHKIEDVRKEMTRYVKTSDASIDSEIYRYLVIPGQAPCYKIGEMILGKIDKSKHKELLLKGWMPLCFVEI